MSLLGIFFLSLLVMMALGFPIYLSLLGSSMIYIFLNPNLTMLTALEKMMNATNSFALLAVPLARSPPRQGRSGRIVIGFLAYLFGMNLMMLGTDWIADGRIPVAFGLWWLVLPLLALATWMYFGDGRIRRPRRAG